MSHYIYWLSWFKNYIKEIEIIEKSPQIKKKPYKKYQEYKKKKKCLVTKIDETITNPRHEYWFKISPEDKSTILSGDIYSINVITL